MFYLNFSYKQFKDNFIILADDQQNTEESIEKLPKVIDCDKVSYYKIQILILTFCIQLLFRY